MAEMRCRRKETKTDREITEAYAEKIQANPEGMKSVEVHEKVPKEEAVVNTVRALKNRYADRHLRVAMGRRRQVKKRGQGDDGSRKKMAAAADGWPAVPFLHRARDTVAKDQAGTMLQ
jgi:hypothetical protein